MSALNRLNGAPSVPLVMTEEEKAAAEQLELRVAKAFALVAQSMDGLEPFAAITCSVMCSGALIRKAEKLGLNQETIAKCLSTGMQLVDQAAARSGESA